MLTGEQARAMLTLLEPCRHLESCVSWNDDAGRRWAGPAVVDDAAERERENIGAPAANTLQRRIEAAVQWCKEHKQPARIIVLKGRRSGSSLICAKIVDLECKWQTTKALMMADQFKRSDEIFDMVGSFAKSDVFPWAFGVEVKTRQIAYGNGSEVRKETALDPNAGRGGGFRVLWFSETAHYPTDGVRDASRLMIATLNTVPKLSGTLVIVESTANGQSGWYYDTWTKARWPKWETYWQKWDQSAGLANEDDGAWIRVFAAWFEIPRNAMPVSEEERGRILAKLDAAETEGVRRYEWAAEQIKWRRWTIANDFQGDAEMFDQEYPSDPQSAFVASGSPAFTRSSLAELRRTAELATGLWKHGVLEAQGATVEDVLNGRMTDIPIKFRETPSELAWVSIIEHPKDGCEYVGTCDPATGALLQETEGNETDLLSVMVLRSGYTQETDGERKTHRPRLVARLRWQVMEGPPSERQTLYMLSLLMRHYGNCTLVVETNKGEWVIVGAKQAALNLYRETIYNRVEDKQTSKLGFTTTEETRHSIITRLQSLVHGAEVEQGGATTWMPLMEVEDLHVVAEMATFVRNKRGRYEAAPGRHDDDVLALAMGAYFLDGATRYRMRVRKRGPRRY